MPVGIISRNWIKSFGKAEDARQQMEQDESQADREQPPEDAGAANPSAEAEARPEGREEETAVDEGSPRPFRLGDNRAERAAKAEQSEAAPREAAAAEEEDEEEEEEVETQGEEDPLAPAYDLEDGTLLEDVDHETAQRRPVSTVIKSAKEFFATEILYRFDVLEPHIQKNLMGSYRIELKGYQGGVWTMTVGEEVDVVNRREDAEVVLSMQQKDFLQLVNGDLNPQIALLAQKVKVTGDIDKAIAVQYLLVPALD